MPISSDELLFVGCVTPDIDRLYANRKWCSVLATDDFVGTDEIVVFDWDKNATTHVIQVGEWQRIQGLVFDVEVLAFDELLEPTHADWDIEAFINEATNGNACHISHIYGAELRAYPQSILEAIRSDKTQIAKEYALPSYKKYRNHPEWAESLRAILLKGSFSSFYDGCGPDLIELGITQGFITPADINRSRGKAQKP